MSRDFNSEYKSLLREGAGALKSAGELLTSAVENVPVADDFQRSYIQQQAASVASVALDVCLLVSNQRFQNVVGLCRIGFESRTSIYAAMRIPEFAAQKYLMG